MLLYCFLKEKSIKNMTEEDTSQEFRLKEISKNELLSNKNKKV